MDDQAQWDDVPTTLGLTIYIEPWCKLGPEPERWSPEKRRQFCEELRKVVEAYGDPRPNRSAYPRWSDKFADVVYQGNNTAKDPIPTSVIIWLNGWYDDPAPENQFQRSYIDPNPFKVRRYLEENGYHVSKISYGFDPVMAG